MCKGGFSGLFCHFTPPSKEVWFTSTIDFQLAQVLYFISLQLLKVGHHRLVLRDVDLTSSGTYTCQITLSGPPFHTEQRDRNLTVISKYFFPALLWANIWRPRRVPLKEGIESQCVRLKSERETLQKVKRMRNEEKRSFSFILGLCWCHSAVRSSPVVLQTKSWFSYMVHWTPTEAIGPAHHSSTL